MGQFLFVAGLVAAIVTATVLGIVGFKPSPKEAISSISEERQAPTSEKRQAPTSEKRQAPTSTNKKTDTPLDSKPVYGVIPGKFVFNYDQINGCIDIRSTGKFQGKDLPELVIACKELLKAWKAQGKLDDAKYRKNKIDEFLNTFTKK